MRKPGRLVVEVAGLSRARIERAPRLVSVPCAVPLPHLGSHSLGALPARRTFVL